MGDIMTTLRKSNCVSGGQSGIARAAWPRCLPRKPKRNSSYNADERGASATFKACIAVLLGAVLRISILNRISYVHFRVEDQDLDQVLYVMDPDPSLF
jgi:hypothetical protein